MPQSAQLTTFANTRTRPFCDAAECAYNTAKRFVSEYDAYGITGMVADMSNTDVILDGSATDGRKPLAVRELKLHRDFCVSYISWYETVQAGLNNKTPLSLVVGASVNGTSKF